MTGTTTSRVEDMYRRMLTELAAGAWPGSILCPREFAAYRVTLQRSLHAAAAARVVVR